VAHPSARRRAFLTYKAVASTGKVSDGEEGCFPWARRIMVTESLPLPIAPGDEDVEFAKLIKSGQSSTLRHQSLTVQMVSNPACMQ